MIKAARKVGWDIESSLEFGMPVVSAWVSIDCSYGFFELRSAEEAEIILNMGIADFKLG